MLYTSAEAAKLVRKLNEEQNVLKQKENKSALFVAAIEEDVESVRPDYDYEEVQKLLAELEAKVRKVKHAINTFNLTTQVPGFDMTVDQMLVYIPQLSEKKSKLTWMAGTLPKERVSASGYGAKTIVEYRYANYDIAKAEADLAAVTDELARAQTALDVINNSATMEIEL
jgi:CRISPR/Cas system CMR subunit Cmr6 (Cas7 group RAMP superfamily)